MYLLDTKSLKMTFRKLKRNLPLVGYSDADRSGDKSDGISMKSSIFMYADGAISWKSKKGKVCQSSTESELLAFIQTCNITVKLRRLIQFINGKGPHEKNAQPTLVFCDNNSQLEIVHQGTNPQKTGHLGLETFVAHQYLKDCIINAVKIDTKYNLADIGTKPIEGKTMKLIRSYLLRK